jgi:hypothetical protein
VDRFARNYLAPALQPFEQAYFKAAGVMPYRVLRVGGSPGGGGAAARVQLLLGVEPRKGEEVLNLLGGKREESEAAAETAWREFWEESGRLARCASVHEGGRAPRHWLRSPTVYRPALLL